MTPEERALLIAVARAVLATTLGASTGYLRGRRVKELADLDEALATVDHAPEPADA